MEQLSREEYIRQGAYAWGFFDRKPLQPALDAALQRGDLVVIIGQDRRGGVSLHPQLDALYDTYIVAAANSMATERTLSSLRRVVVDQASQISEARAWLYLEKDERHVACTDAQWADWSKEAAGQRRHRADARASGAALDSEGAVAAMHKALRENAEKARRTEAARAARAEAQHQLAEARARRSADARASALVNALRFLKVKQAACRTSGIDDSGTVADITKRLKAVPLQQLEMICPPLAVMVNEIASSNARAKSVNAAANIQIAQDAGMIDESDKADVPTDSRHGAPLVMLGDPAVVHAVASIASDPIENQACVPPNIGANVVDSTCGNDTDDVHGHGFASRCM